MKLTQLDVVTPFRFAGKPSTNQYAASAELELLFVPAEEVVEFRTKDAAGVFTLALLVPRDNVACMRPLPAGPAVVAPPPKPAPVVAPKVAPKTSSWKK